MNSIDKELLEKLQDAIKVLGEVEHALEEALTPPKLRPCPFCGKPVIYHTTVYQKLDQRGFPCDSTRYYWVKCYDHDCNVNPETKWRLTKEEAAEDWNNRCEEISNGQVK